MCGCKRATQHVDSNSTGRDYNPFADCRVQQAQVPCYTVTSNGNQAKNDDAIKDTEPAPQTIKSGSSPQLTPLDDPEVDLKDPHLLKTALGHLTRNR
jgi:hypothetical protein